MDITLLIGWLLTLATVIATVGRITKALILLIRSEASEFKQVSGDDAIRAMIREVVGLFGLLRQRWLATVCSVALLSTLLLLGVDGIASFGYSAITFVIAGLATSSAPAEDPASALADARLNESTPGSEVLASSD